MNKDTKKQDEPTENPMNENEDEVSYSDISRKGATKDEESEGTLPLTDEESTKAAPSEMDENWEGED